MKSSLRGLYAITPDWSDTPRLMTVTEAILKGGCRVIQYRHKMAPPRLRLEQATALRRLAKAYGALLIVNDDIELALTVAADGLHVGLEDGDPSLARDKLGPDGILGVSCYQDCDRADHAVALGADYVAFGSFFASPTKPQARRAGLELLDATVCPLSVPRVAIGGINLDNARPLVQAGADMLAVISGVYDSASPEQASRQFQSYFQ